MSRRVLKSFKFLIVVAALLSSPVYAKKMPGGMPPAVVEAAPVVLQDWQPGFNAIGTLSSSQGVVVKPEVGGRITAIYFRSGEYVQAGTPLVQINPDILKAQLASAQAKVLLSKANYERTQTLFKKKVFAEADLDNALATYQMDQATVAQDQALLDQTLIRAPFAGRLGLRSVNLGDYLTVGQAITNLEDIDPLRIDFNVPEAFLSQLAIGQTILIRSDTYPNKIFQGRVYAFDSTVDPDTRTLAARASLPNKNGQLLPGAFVDVTLQTGQPQKLITIPETAISYSADGEYVYKVVNNQAIKTKVTLGRRKNNQVAILSGLSAGDTVVTAGQLKIMIDKAPVIISNSNPAKN